jgi:hypothetical protein
MARPSKRWDYGYTDLAGFLSMSEGAVRQAVYRGDFDPDDLDSLFEFKLQRAGGLSEERRSRMQDLVEAAQSEARKKVP